MSQVLSKLVLAPYLKNDLTNCSIAGPGMLTYTETELYQLLKAQCHEWINRHDTSATVIVWHCLPYPCSCYRGWVAS
jgi:hypothetical protein